MKNHFKYAAALLLGLMLFCACSDEEEIPGPQNLPVNYANIAGTWKQTEWNGEQMNDDRYLYIIIERKPDDETGLRAFEIYQNIDSNKSRHLTSTYELEADEDLGTIIRGIYDHASGFWNSSYLITDLSGDKMTWIVEDDPSDVSVYTRCESIPEDILNGTRAAQ